MTCLLLGVPRGHSFAHHRHIQLDCPCHTAKDTSDGLQPRRWGSHLEQGDIKTSRIFVSKILFLEQVGICLDQTRGSGAEKERIQRCGGCSHSKPCLVFLTPPAPVFGWDNCCGETPVCTGGLGVEPLGEEGQLQSLGFPDSLLRKG